MQLINDSETPTSLEGSAWTVGSQMLIDNPHALMQLEHQVPVSEECQTLEIRRYPLHWSETVML
jgi:hypothetical protein